MRFVIVTGVSGAGKSTALKMLEDAEYFCVDNLPIPLMEKFASMMADSNAEEIQNAGLGVDVRSGQALDELEGVLQRMKQQGYDYEILFLDASDEVLIKRYQETRRSHPLAPRGRVGTGIRLEREKLKFLKNRADYIIDTSQLLTRELREEIEGIFINNRQFESLMVSIVSFGFKYGIPNDSSLLFDARFLPNPYYLDHLRHLTGENEEVFDYVMSFEAAQIFADKMEDLFRYLIPQYIKEGKTSLVVGIGCTGGRHRSVTLAKELYRRLKGEQGCGLRIEHRDLEK
ncbi:MAG: RNase adapter RapZ [Lachnospiraceae bacterium]|nr:RNase adapter RapZ [Lachnospiraceae bacterium]MCI9356352.1 RNase adapter RapZ [Lachnospiraceae bacterium]